MVSGRRAGPLATPEPTVGCDKAGLGLGLDCLRLAPTVIWSAHAPKQTSALLMVPLDGHVMLAQPLGPAVFLSPHADDVPLSCGGTAARFAAAGQASHIVTLFAGEVVPRMVGPLAAWKHARWNLHDVDAVIETRRAEDAKAAAALGCSIRWLGLPDAIYRVGRYASDAELFGDLGDEEHALAEHLVEELTGLPEWQPGASVFVPLGIGSHVDHQIAFETGRRLASRGYRVFAYEDAPYVIHTPSGLDERLARIGGHLGEPVTVPIYDQIEARLQAIGEYRTQVPVIFRFTDDFRRAVTEHAMLRGNGDPAERLWPVQPR